MKGIFSKLLILLSLLKCLVGMTYTGCDLEEGDPFRNVEFKGSQKDYIARGRLASENLVKLQIILDVSLDYPFTGESVEAGSRVIIVPILHGMGFKTSTYKSNQAWQTLLQELENRYKKEGKAVRIIPLSLALPFYGGPIDSKFGDIAEFGIYIKDTVLSVTQRWISAGHYDASSQEIVLMGRSTGGTLALWLHTMYPDLFPKVITSSPMLSNPHLHLWLSEQKLRSERFLLRNWPSISRDHPGSKLENLDINLLNHASSLVAQADIENRLQARRKGSSDDVKIFWSERDIEYPQDNNWRIHATELLKGLDVCFLPTDVHNNLLPRLVFRQPQISDLVLPRLRSIFLGH
jgi:hypothetical protein